LNSIISKDTKVFDLKGKTLMPGIIDSHFRPILNGLIGDSIDSAIINIGLSRSKSIIEILNLLETAIKNKNLVNGSQLWGMNQRLYWKAGIQH
jgi:predicted amidohydrolase YtcJ